jgi:hypothetical protein
MEVINEEYVKDEKEIIPKPIEMVDDSFVFEEDKKELIKQLKELYEKKHIWADKVLIECLVKWHYNETIKNLDKEIYLQEKKEQSEKVMSVEDYLNS